MPWPKDPGEQKIWNIVLFMPPVKKGILLGVPFTTGTKHNLWKEKKKKKKAFPKFSDFLRLDDPDPGASIMHYYVMPVMWVEQCSMRFKQTVYNYIILEIFRCLLKFSIIPKYCLIH